MLLLQLQRMGCVNDRRSGWRGREDAARAGRNAHANPVENHSTAPESRNGSVSD